MRAYVRTRFSNLKVIVSTLLAFAVLAAPFAVQNVFAASYTVCDTGCDYSSLEDAVNGASNGDTISLAGTYNITSTIVVDKSVSIVGQTGATINTSGTSNVLTITAAGTEIRNLTFNRTENDLAGATQNMIGIQANNVSIIDSTFTGQYVFGVNGVSRALVISPGVTGFNINGNSFTNLRQPAYSDGSGSFTNNYTAGTRGFVASSNTSITFTDNTWGTGAQRNILDIAILSTGVNNYPDNVVVQISDQNNDAVVENQFGGTPVLSDVFVDASAAVGGNGLPGSAYQTINPAATRVANGGTINVASGTYPVTAQTTFNKTVNVRGVGTKPQLNITAGAYYVFLMKGTGSTVSNFAFNKADSANQNLIGIQASNTTISNNTFAGQYILGGGETTRAIEVSNHSNITINDNTITGLRQPAYINNGATGSLLNNSVNGTRGWVVEAGSDFTITGNTFSGNAVDVAIIAGTPNNYDCARTNLIRTTNNNANVDNQILGSSCPENVPPSVPVNGQPHNAFRNTNDFYFMWDASTDNAPGTITYEFQSAQTNTTDSNGALLNAWNNITNGNSEQNNLTSPSIHSVGAPDGTWHWQVRAIDAAGNKSAWSTVWNMTIDTVPPAAPQNLSFVNPTLACNTFTNSYTITPRWDAVADAVQYEYWVVTPARTESSAWTTTVNSNSYAGAFTEGQGTYTFKVRAIDASGLKSAWSNTCAITYDATAPDAFLVSPSDNSFVNGASLTQTWGSNTPSDVSYYVYESYNNAEATSLRWRENFTTTSKTATNVGNSTFWWRVKAVDAVGNESAWSQLWKITVDSTAPATPTLASPANESFVNTPTFNFSWNPVTDSSGVTYEWQSAYSTATTANGSFTNPIVTHSNLTATTLASPSTPDNTYYWHVRARDAAGNYSAWSTVWKVTVDATAPVISGDQTATGEGSITPVLTAIDNNPGSMTYLWTPADPSYANIISDPTVLNPTFSPTTTGTYQFTVTATDQANNTSESFNFSFTYTQPEDEFEDVETPAPTGPTDTPAAEPPLNVFGNAFVPQAANIVANPIVAAVAGGAPANQDAQDGQAQDGGEVLGTNTDNNSNSNGQNRNTAEVLGATTEENTSSAFKWYWLPLILVVIGALYWLVARGRRQKEN